MTVEEFFAVLKKSGLLDPEQFALVRGEVARWGSNISAEEVAERLSQGGRLTRWQAFQLLAGWHYFYINQYKLLDEIGRGGMGFVYKAEHAVMGRMVALKVLSKARLDNPTAIARFQREVRAAAKLDHPNIVTAHDAGVIGDTHFLVMEYVDGRDLNSWLKYYGMLQIPWASEFVRQAALGLEYAHQQKMVHRDIKPANILVHLRHPDPPVVKILDLGLARFTQDVDVPDPQAGRRDHRLGPEEPSGPVQDTEPGQMQDGLTQHGQILGTPDYLAPEQIQGTRDVDIRADIFSLGVTFFKLLTGQLPFGGPGTSVVAKMMARTQRDAAPAPLVRTLRVDIPPELEQIVARMLALDPRQRFQTPAEVAQALTPFAFSTAQSYAQAHLQATGDMYGAGGDNYAAPILPEPAYADHHGPIDPTQDDDTRAFLSLLANNYARPANSETSPGGMLPPLASPLMPPPNRGAGGVLAATAASQAATGSTPPMALPLNSPARKTVLVRKSPGEILNRTPGNGLPAAGMSTPMPGTQQAVAGARPAEATPGSPRPRRRRRRASPVIAMAIAGVATVVIGLGLMFAIANWRARRTAQGVPSGAVETATPPGLPVTKSAVPPVPRRAPPRTERPSGAALSGHLKGVLTLATSPRGDRIVSGGMDGAIRLWSYHESVRELPLEPGANPDWINAVCFSPDGFWAAAGGRDQKVRVWSVRTPGPPLVFSGHEAAISALAFSPDSANLASGDYANQVRVTQVATGKHQRLRGKNLEAEHPRGRVMALTFADGSVLAALGGEGTTLACWDLMRDRKVYEIERPEEDGEPAPVPATCAAFSPDGDLLAFGLVSGAVNVIDLQEQVFRHRLGGHKGWVSGLAFSADSRRLASAGHDKTVRWYTLGDFQSVELAGHQDQVQAVAFSPDGRTLVSGSRDKLLRIWPLPE